MNTTQALGILYLSSNGSKKIQFFLMNYTSPIINEEFFLSELEYYNFK